MIEKYAPLRSLFLIQGCTYCLCFFLSLICSWLSNNPLAIINSPNRLLLSMSVIFLKITALFTLTLIFVLKNVYF